MALATVSLALLASRGTEPEAAIPYALDLAARSGARLIAAVAVPPLAAPALAYSGYAVATQMLMVIERENAARKEDAEAKAEHLRAEAERLGVAAEVEVVSATYDSPTALLLRRARVSDLCVMSAPPPGEPGPRDLFVDMLFGAVVPLLAVPAGWRPGPIRKALVAWDQGRAAARAVHDALPLLRAAQDIEIVCVEGDKELGAEAAADLAPHLAGYGPKVSVTVLPRRAEGVAAALCVHARHAGAEVLISVSDDGKGLNAQRIRAKAEENGLLAPGAVVSDAELHQLIFHPGFSTAAQISSLSGRGVGMDVVRRTIEGMRGTIDIATDPGRGTTFTLRLPLTLAIIEGLLVRVAETRYVVPLTAVEECVELPAQAGAPSKGRSFLNIRGDLVPFLRLRELFGETGENEPHQKVVIVSHAETRVGLVVDQIIGSHQTVIKSLSKLHADAASFSGATILGDGAVALILDAPQLIAAGQMREARLNTHRPEAA